MRNYSLLVIICSIVAFNCCGCNKNSYPLAKVSGRVTKGGKPVANASVIFQPMAGKQGINPGPGSYGITDADGRYKLKTYREKTEGVIVGRHRVTINLPLPPGVPDDDKINPLLLAPLEFRNGSMEIEIPKEGVKSSDFDLVSESNRKLDLPRNGGRLNRSANSE